jgi:hypothetical protein
MGLGDGIRDLVADVGVQTADINSAAVTEPKIALSVGKWAAGTFVSGTTTWTGTAAFTVLQGMIRITAAAAGIAYMGTTADADAVFACTSTLASTYASGAGLIALNAVVNVVTAQNTGMPEISAAGSVLICAAASVAGKYYFAYITTPT